MTSATMWEIEDSFYDQGLQVICGVDEAGRGPLAGPVCAAAVILPRGLEIPGLQESRELVRRVLRPKPHVMPCDLQKRILERIRFPHQQGAESRRHDEGEQRQGERDRM